MGAVETDQEGKISGRYSRQVLFAPIGRDGQEKLLASRVLIVGCGALGCAQAEMLARAGVGKLRIVDRDFVEFSNLQRQTLFSETDAIERLPKAVAAEKRLAEINSSIDIEAIVADVNNSNIRSLIKDCDLVVDGTDNFQTRYLLNDACVKHKVTWIYGAAVSSYGTTMTIIPGTTPCLRCVFEEMPDAGSSPTCDTAGVIMPIIQTIAAAQVSEALKFLVGDTASLHNSLMQFDVWTNERHAIKASRNPDCKCCGKDDFEFLDAASQEFSAVLCGRNAVQIGPSANGFDLDALATRLRSLGEVKLNEYLLRFATGDNEITVFRDGRAIIKGTDDISVARSIYARFVWILMKISFLLFLLVFTSFSPLADERADVLKKCESLYGPTVDEKLSLYSIDKNFVLQVESQDGNIVGLSIKPKYFFNETHPDWEAPDNWPVFSTKQYKDYLIRLEKLKPKGRWVGRDIFSYVTNSTGWPNRYYERALVIAGEVAGTTTFRALYVRFVMSTSGIIQRKWEVPRRESTDARTAYRIAIDENDGRTIYWVPKSVYYKARVGKSLAFRGILTGP